MMPIEIRELIIRTNIVDEDSMKMNRVHFDSKYKTEREIIDRCVAKVLRRISKRKER